MKVIQPENSLYTLSVLPKPTSIVYPTKPTLDPVSYHVRGLYPPHTQSMIFLSIGILGSHEYFILPIYPVNTLHQ